MQQQQQQQQVEQKGRSQASQCTTPKPWHSSTLRWQLMCVLEVQCWQISEERSLCAPEMECGNRPACLS
jgi:hypothetical protein